MEKNTETNTALGSDFRTRLLTAFIGVPIALLLVYLGSWFWVAVVVVTGIVCGQELHHMIDPDDPISLVAQVLLILGVLGSGATSGYLFLGLLLVFIVVQAGRWMLTESSSRDRLVRISIYVVLGALYIGVPLSLAIALRNMDRGFEWTVIAFANNWATDGFALIGGRIAGRHKLAPRISPGKTVEGALIGLVSGFLMGMFAAAVFRMPVGLSIIANVAVAVMTLLGDLLESWVKRMFSVKDAGSLLPGHGGLLDRIDGMLLAVPVLYLILVLKLGA